MVDNFIFRWIEKYVIWKKRILRIETPLDVVSNWPSGVTNLFLLSYLSLKHIQFSIFDIYMVPQFIYLCRNSVPLLLSLAKLNQFNLLFSVFFLKKTGRKKFIKNLFLELSWILGTRPTANFLILACF